MSPYAELQVTSNYSFLRGASHPHELAIQAKLLGHDAIAITDHNTLAGAVRMHVACKQHDIRMIVGARLDLEDSPSFLCFPTNRAAYGRLSQLLSLGKQRAGKGQCYLFLEDILKGEFFHAGNDQILVVISPNEIDNAFRNILKIIRNKIKKNIYLSVNYIYSGYDKKRLLILEGLAQSLSLPLVATNDVYAHIPERKALQDVLTCIREGCTIHEAGFLLHANAERHLKSRNEMARLFADYPKAIANSMKIASKCRFSLDELRYEYPVDPTPGGRTPQQELVHLTWEGADERYPENIPNKIKKQLIYELTLIEELGYAGYFLTIHDLVSFARSRSILCQGRGSAANSSVCYMLGITSVNPVEIDLLFERFVSAERNEPPDIDVDFEHERREEVIQYIYDKYGRNRAGITATHITYRYRSVFREVGKVMGLTEDSVQALSSAVNWGRSSKVRFKKRYIREIGLDPNDPTLKIMLDLTQQIIGFPRHLSQHTGGFVITKGLLDTVVPIENAAMEDRTVIEWDKNDLDALGILKVDVLALGMLTCIRKAFDLIEHHHGHKLTLANIPQRDQQTYDMLCQGDSIGVFQVESRAQMNMLPRLRPRTYYDLVIEVAIVRPGPIQGDMVHPFLRRRHGKEKVYYPNKELEEVLGKTMGVPLFQEQAMKIAIVAAKFTPNEADGLRRAMATFRNRGTLILYRERFINGMIQNGYELAFAERCFKQIEGFGDYGFPESHAASFALLVYVSAWLKCHYPAAFSAAILNSQPMGFYKPAQLIQNARDHGVTVREVDVNDSEWDCTLEKIENIFPNPLPIGKNKNMDANIFPSSLFQKSHKRMRSLNVKRSSEDKNTALRLGLRQIKTIQKDAADLLVNVREQGYSDISELKTRTGLKRAVLERFARADTFQSLGLDRRRALWTVRGLSDEIPLPLFKHLYEHQFQQEPDVHLPKMHLGEQVADDYKALKFSLRAHPMELLRSQFETEKHVTCASLTQVSTESMVRLAGVVLIRQRPSSAKGVIFITIEDETGFANLIVWPQKVELYRRSIFGSQLLSVEGTLQREGIVTHIIAERLFDYSYRLSSLTSKILPISNIIQNSDTPAKLSVKGKGVRKIMPGSRDFK